MFIGHFLQKSPIISCKVFTCIVYICVCVHVYSKPLHVGVYVACINVYV